MQVLLIKDVNKLGYRGDIVKVKEGYFRNFLQPRKLAEMATESVKKLAVGRKEKVLLDKKRIIDNAKDVLARLKGLKLIFKQKVSDKGKLYGSITEVEIIGAIEKKVNVKLEKEYVKMAHIKEAGNHEITVHLGEGLEEVIKVAVQAAK